MGVVNELHQMSISSTETKVDGAEAQHCSPISAFDNEKKKLSKFYLRSTMPSRMQRCRNAIYVDSPWAAIYFEPKFGVQKSKFDLLKIEPSSINRTDLFTN